MVTIETTKTEPRCVTRMNAAVTPGSANPCIHWRKVLSVLAAAPVLTAPASSTNKTSQIAAQIKALGRAGQFRVMRLLSVSFQPLLLSLEPSPSALVAGSCSKGASASAPPRRRWRRQWFCAKSGWCIHWFRTPSHQPGWPAPEASRCQAAANLQGWRWAPDKAISLPESRQSREPMLHPAIRY